MLRMRRLTMARGSTKPQKETGITPSRLAKTLGERLRQLRNSQKVTLVELAKASGVDIATISRIETGGMVGTLKSHLRLATALGVTIVELYAGLEEAKVRRVAILQTSSQRRLAQHNSEGGWKLRVSRRQGRGKLSARLRIKCGCCHKKVDIWHGPDALEINGVNASLGEWRRILLPLLWGRGPNLSRTAEETMRRLRRIQRELAPKARRLGIRTEADVQRIVEEVRREERNR